MYCIDNNYFVCNEKRYEFDQKLAVRLQVNLTTLSGLNVFVAETAQSEEIFKFIIDFAIKNEISRYDAGKFCALYLGVSSIYKVHPNPDIYKPISNKWETICRVLPLKKDIENNPNKSYAELCQELDEKSRVKREGRKISKDIYQWKELKNELKIRKNELKKLKNELKKLKNELKETEKIMLKQLLM